MGWLAAALAAAFAAYLLQYLVPHVLLCLFCRDADLKARYNAKWGLVTGASSGIGKALAKKLASQGINVVLVALDDPLLAGARDELAAAFPEVEIRAVGADLGAPGALYIKAIAAATADVDVQCVFCNAGYMVTGFFESTPLEAQLANLECNATSAVAISHLFLQRMAAKNLKGCIVLTSSAAAAIASPFTALYAATKAFVSSFGASLAVEARHRGVDVLVFHPSPVASRFYDKAHKLDVLDFFKGVAVHPDALPPLVFGSVGRAVWRDVGSTALGFRLMMKLVDYSFMAALTALAAPLLPDFKRAVAAQAGKGKKKA